MPITINGTTGIAGIDGSASAPAVEGSDADTGIFFPSAGIVAVTNNGTERLRVAASGQVGIGGANYGTAGQVLTSGGSGTAPSWADKGGSVMEYIAYGVGSNLSALSFTSIPSGYTTLYLHFAFVSGSGSTPTLRVALSSNNGSTYGTVRQISDNPSSPVVQHGWVSITNVSSSGTSKVVTPAVASVEKLNSTTVNTQSTYTTAATEATITGVINALQVTASSGASFSVTLYGIK